jgi:hypothetical protein
VTATGRLRLGSGRRADYLLRLTGLTCLIGFLVCFGGVLLALLVGGSFGNQLLKWAGIGAALFFFLPAGVMALHLAASDDLTEAEKTRWDKVGRWGISGFFVAFFYLMRKDRRLPRPGGL